MALSNTNNASVFLVSVYVFPFCHRIWHSASFLFLSLVRKEALFIRITSRGARNARYPSASSLLLASPHLRLLSRSWRRLMRLLRAVLCYFCFIECVVTRYSLEQCNVGRRERTFKEAADDGYLCTYRRGFVDPVTIQFVSLQSSSPTWSFALRRAF